MGNNTAIKKKTARQWTVEELRRENERRHAALRVPYDPETGRGCHGKRQALRIVSGAVWFLPLAMLDEFPVPRLQTMPLVELERARIRYDFEYWCWRCATLSDKMTGALQPVRLNAAQRRVLGVLERQRLAGKPIRVILLKARQWGGSTLVQLYMTWIQLVLHPHWNSLVCAHTLGTAAIIHDMLNRVLRDYPEEMAPDGERPRLAPIKNCSSARRLTGVDSLVVTGTAHNNEVVRGYDVKMAHLSEVAFWPDTPRHSPIDVMRSVNGTVPLAPLSLVVLESTANGMGNYFHDEWLRARSGKSDKEAVFVPWYEIEIYRLPVDDIGALWAVMDEYERALWEDYGCTLESINWYHHKRLELSSAPALFIAEFPTTDIEAFSCNTRHVFAPEHLDALRQNAREPEAVGEIRSKRRAGRVTHTEFFAMTGGQLRVWEHPPRDNPVRDRYVVAVDVGGRSERSDWSVVTVFDRLGECGKPEVVAQWRGHCDHDILARRAVDIATYYHRALLVIESNTLESERTEGDGGQYILKEIGESYPNMYYRQRFERDESSKRPGFQTNVATKQMVVYNLIAWVRDGRYIERDNEAVNELSWFELKPNGTSYGAMRGRHDDLVMTRAIGLWVIAQFNNAHAMQALEPGDFLN